MKKIFYCLSINYYNNQLKIDKYEVSDTDEEFEDFATFDEYVNYCKEEAIAEAEQHLCSAIILEQEHIEQFAMYFGFSKK